MKTSFGLLTFLLALERVVAQGYTSSSMTAAPVITSSTAGPIVSNSTITTTDVTVTVTSYTTSCSTDTYTSTTTATITETYCHLCEPTPQPGVYTTYTTVMLDVCPTGLEEKVYIITEPCTATGEARAPGYVPAGFTTTPHVCTICSPETSVVLTVPAPTATPPPPPKPSPVIECEECKTNGTAPITYVNAGPTSHLDLFIAAAGALAMFFFIH